MWSNVVLVLAVIPWLSYAVVLLFFSLSILYGSVSLRLSLVRFNDHFPGGHWTGVSRYKNVCIMDFTGIRMMVGGW